MYVNGESGEIRRRCALNVIRCSAHTWSVSSSLVVISIHKRVLLSFWFHPSEEAIGAQDPLPRFVCPFCDLEVV